MESKIKYFQIIILIFIFLSCSKINYLVEQGIGQLRIQLDGRDIKEVIDDPKTKTEVKDKLLAIEKYKNYFFKYFNREKTSIYSKVTFLEQDAVTYLVIVSPFNRVSPIKHRFPIVGEFPYLGFFDKESALDFKQEQVNQSRHTFMRPVYAYSSLGHFEDRILSSFFKFKEFDLAELIFHELFHTVFFIEDKVDLNENLANYFGKELAFEYFNYDAKKIKAYKTSFDKRRELKSFLANLIKTYDQGLKKSAPKTIDDSYQRLNQYILNTFNPKIKIKCQELAIEEKKCFPLQYEWNHARFAAYMTYEKDMNFFYGLRKHLKINLYDYLVYLENSYRQFQAKDLDISYIEYLKKVSGYQ